MNLTPRIVLDNKMYFFVIVLLWSSLSKFEYSSHFYWFSENIFYKIKEATPPYTISELKEIHLINIFDKNITGI